MPSPPDDTAPAPPAAPAPASEAELISALRFSHMLEMQTKVQLVELTASFRALLDAVAPAGTAARAAFDAARPGALAGEQQKAAREVLVVVDNTPDKYALGKLPEIDCASRLPLCRARCCTLKFALSTQDLDEGVIRFDYGRPYQIRQRPDGYCTHNEPGTHRCTEHAARPAVCRLYDCRTDARIWLDFERRIPASVAPASERTAGSGAAP